MKKIIIIGGGISGLSAGIYAQKNGFQSIIIEKNSNTGGECTGWNRNGFHIDGCIHWLMGTKENTKLNKTWKEVGALEENTKIHKPEYFVKVNYNNIDVFMYRDLEKLKNHLINISIEDKEEIKKLCDYIEAFSNFEPPIEKPMDMMNIFEKIKYISSMKKIGPIIKKMNKLNVRKYSEKFKNTAIRKALLSIVPEHYSAYLLVSSIATFINGNGDRPAGGSYAFTQRMEKNYINLGGKIFFNKPVKKIIINKNKAIGIKTEDNQEIFGNYIIPACDTNVILNQLLEKKYHDKRLMIRYQNKSYYPLHSSVYISLAVDYDLSNYPQDLIFQTEAFKFEDNELDTISMKHYSYEPSFSPKGKSILIIYFQADYDWWKNLKSEYYKNEKYKITKKVIIRIEKKFPILKNKIKALDFVTPLTYERYCNAYKGSWMSFGITPSGKQLMHNGKIKGINNLYMAGQWLMPPGGLPTALLTGKWAIQRIKEKEKMNY